MATEEGLKIRIGATLDALKKGISDAKAAITGLGKSVKQESDAVESAGKNWNQLGKFIFEAQYQRRRMIQQINQGIGAWKLEAKAIEEVGKNSLPKLDRTSRLATSSLTSLNQIVQDFPYGVRGWGNNAMQAATQVGYLIQQTGSFSGALKSLGTSFLGSGGIIFGVSLLINGYQKLTEEYDSLGAAVSAILKPLTEQQRLQKLIRDTFLEGQKNAQSELVQLDKLYKATQNLNIPLSERNKIVDKLQKDYPSYFGSLSNEAILTGNAADAYDRLRDAIIGAATVRAIDKQLEELGEDLAKVKQEQNQLNKTVSEATNLQGKLNKELEEFDKRNAGTSALIVAEQRAEILAKIGGASQSVRIATTALDENYKAQEKVNASQRELQGIQQSIIQNFGAFGAGVTSSTEKVRTISDVLKTLQQEMTAIDEYNKLVGMSSDNLAKQKLSALNKAFEDIAKIGGPQAGKELQRIQNQINLLGNSIIGDKKIDGTQLISFDKKKIKGPDGLEAEGLVMRIPVSVDQSAILKGAAEAQAALAAGIIPIKNTIEKFDLELTQQINDLIENATVNGIGNIAGAIGEAISGGGIGPVINAFVSTISGFLTQMGELLIAQGISLEAFKKSLSSFQGFPAIVAGAGLIAAAAAFKSFAGKGIGSFATGGTAYGAQLAVIGDNPGREEHIIPSEVMDKLGRGGYPSEITLRAYGGDLVGILKMGQIQNGRING